MVGASFGNKVRPLRSLPLRIRYGWRMKLTLSIGALVALFVGLLVYLNASTQLSFIQNRYLDGARNLGTIVREVSLPYLIEARPAELDIIYEEWSDQPNVLELEFIDDDNFLLVTSASNGGKQFLSLIADPLVDQARTSGAVATAEHEGFIMMAFPVTVGTRYLGTIRLKYGRDLVNEEVRVVVQKNLLLGVLFTAAGLLVSTWLASSITAPLRKLDMASKQAADGDLSQRITIHSNDEVGSLARSFNMMLDRLGERVDALEATKQQLSVSKRDLERQNDLLQQAVADAEQAKSKAETAETAKSHFVARMSHEIRTPLNGVLGMTELLSETDMSSAQADLLDTIRASGESLLAVVNDILDFSKIESGHMLLRSESFDLVDLVDSTAKSFAAPAGKAGLEIVAQIAPDLPAWISGDAVRLKQVLTNLVGNALKFTDTGYVQISVRRDHGGTDGELLRFDIEDSGCGIPADEMDTLFDEFTQVDVSHSRAHEGTGLGLAISQGFVELMGGRIWAQSEKGTGTVFSFVIPLVEAEREAGKPALADPDLGGRQILIALNSGVAAAALSNRLAGWNAEVVIAAEEADFEAQVNGTPAPVLIIDLSQIRTFENELRNWRKRWADDPEAQIIALADPGRGAAMGASAEKLADQVVFKPISTRKLAEIVAGRKEDPNTQEQPVLQTGKTRPAATKVLLVDDNATNRKIVQLLLDRQKVSYECAADGREAIARFSDFRPDIVLMDVSMPVLNGFDATRAIRAIEQEEGLRPCRIIGLTAHSSPGDRTACLESGMDEHIAKPVKLDILRRFIEPDG
jgi:signal transduction histidine kinase/CheY-like chemotaxis protein